MLVERRQIHINGTDFSSFFGDVGYSVQYVRVAGNNGGMMQDGTLTLDTLKWNTVITLPTWALNEARLASLLSVVVTDYVTVEYYDPKSRAYKTISAIPSEQTMKYRGRGADGLSYWTGETLVLTEQ